MSSTDILTAALVLITGYYAWQNRRMVQEMAAARSTAVLPHLALQFHGISPVLSLIRIESVGQGPALDVDVDIQFVPKADAGDPVVRHISTNLMAPGENRDLLPVFGQNDEMLDMEGLARRFDRIELSGTLRDIAGNQHTAQDVLRDLAGWREVQAAARVRWTDPDPGKRLAKELEKALKR